MTFEPAAPKLVLTAGAIRSVERPHCSLTGTLTQQTRAAFERKKKSSTVIPPNPTCFPHRPHSSPVRPNFFIPIMTVGSYVLPFFMMMFISVYAGCIPGLQWLYLELSKVTQNSLIHTGLPLRILLLPAVSAPMVAGALSAYFLSKNARLNVKLKLLAWFLLVLLFCLVEYFSDVFFAFP